MFSFIKKIWKRILSLFNLGRKRENLVNYICGGEALPSPLSPEEEKEAIELASSGDENARTKLIEHNLRLVVYIAKRFENSKADIEDLISVGTIGLIKAVNSFDNNKNIKLATYASRCIENEILMFLRKTSKLKSEVSLDEPLNVDWEGNVLLLSDILGSETDSVYKDIENNVEKEILWKSFDKLSEREREIIKMRFGLLGQEEKTQKEIADMLNISQSYISRLEKKILTNLKKEIAKMV